MPKKFTILIVTAVAVLLFSAGCILSETSETQLEQEYTKMTKAVLALSEVMDQRQTAFLGDALLVRDKIAGDPENLSLITGIFYDFYIENPTVDSVYFINRTGHVTAAVPHTMEKFLGTFVPEIDNSSTAKIIGAGLFDNIHENRLMPGELIPVVNNGVYYGSIVTVLDTSPSISQVKSQYPNSDHWSIWTMNKEGTIIRAPYIRYVGLNSSDADSPDRAGFLKVIEHVRENSSGADIFTSYSFLQMKVADFAIVWNTISIVPEGDDTFTIILMSELSERQPYAEPVVSTDKNLEEFVRSAYLYALENGKEAALKEFNDPNGIFTTKEFYITAQNRTTILADPYAPGFVNTTSMYIDGNGVVLGDIFNSRAEKGGGYVFGLYPNPAESMQEQFRVSYVLPIDEEWYIMAGSYDDVPAVVDRVKLNQMIQYLRSVYAYAHATDKETAIAYLNSPNTQYYPEGVRFLGMDYEGVVLVDPVYPEFVGKDMMAMTDFYGSSVVREAITCAKEGGGLQYVYAPIEDNSGKFELRLEYVLPVNDEGLILAAIPV